MRATHTFLLLAVALSVGCSDEASGDQQPAQESDAGAIDAAGGGTIREATVASELAQAYCDVAALCCADVGLSPNDGCLEETIADFEADIAAEIGLGREVFDPLRAAECVEFIRAFAICRPGFLYWNVYNPGVGNHLCRYYLSPGHLSGESCNQDEDCRVPGTATRCETQSRTCIEVRRVLDGQPCGPTDEPHVWDDCPDTSSCEDSVCSPRAGEGERCAERPCLPGFQCPEGGIHDADPDRVCALIEGMIGPEKCYLDANCKQGNCHPALDRCIDTPGRAGDPCESHGQCLSGRCSGIGEGPGTPLRCEAMSVDEMSDGTACAAQR